MLRGTKISILRFYHSHRAIDVTNAYTNLTCGNDLAWGSYFKIVHRKLVVHKIVLNALENYEYSAGGFVIVATAVFSISNIRGFLVREKENRLSSFNRALLITFLQTTSCTTHESDSARVKLAMRTTRSLQIHWHTCQFDDVLLLGNRNLKLLCRENETYDSSRSRTEVEMYSAWFYRYEMQERIVWNLFSFFFFFFHLFLHSCRSQPYRAVEREK